MDFRSINIPSEVRLADRLQDNPFHPFQQIHLGKLEYTSRYSAFYVSIIGLGSSVLAAVIFIIVGILDGHSLKSPLFPMPFCFIAMSIAGLVNFNDIKTLALFPLSNEYSFSYGSKEHIRGGKHNIYIRLRRDHRSESSNKWYYLVLKGYEVERIDLCSPTKNLDEIRRLGQQLALNLNINYFDEANISKHHVIRHFKPDKDSLAIKKI